MTPDFPLLVRAIHAIALRASSVILDVYETEFEVQEKADRTLLTRADLASHALICQALHELTPDIPIISEEEASIPLEQRSQWPWLWLVDPLDGTREFVQRSGEFSVNIALVHEHRPVLGLILIPVRQWCYYAWQDGGAYKEAPGEPVRAIRAAPLGDGPIRVAGSRSFTGAPLHTYLELLGRHHYRGVGSALKSCLVAEGVMDLYPRFGPTCEWDTAAAQIILEEAGGRLTDLFMRPLRYNARPTLYNPDFFAFGDPNHDWSQYLPRRKPRR